MILIKTQQDLLATFRPRDRKTVELSPDLTFPLVIRGMFSWVDPTAVRVHTILEEPGTQQALGLSFRRDVDGAGIPGGRICDWCHAYGSADRISMLTCEKTSKRRVGAILCRDLQCGVRVEEAANLAGKNVQVAQRALMERVWRFAHEGLGIGQVVVEPHAG